MKRRITMPKVRQPEPPMVDSWADLQSKIYEQTDNMDPFVSIPKGNYFLSQPLIVTFPAPPVEVGFNGNGSTFNKLPWFKGNSLIELHRPNMQPCTIRGIGGIGPIGNIVSESKHPHRHATVTESK